jgi:hypothetical protein
MEGKGTYTNNPPCWHEKNNASSIDKNKKNEPTVGLGGISEELIAQMAFLIYDSMSANTRKYHNVQHVVSLLVSQRRGEGGLSRIVGDTVIV